MTRPPSQDGGRDATPPTTVGGAVLYLRIGDWDPQDPRSYNYALGEREAGLSAYDLDAELRPVVPEEGEWAETDMRERLASELPKHLIVGRLVGEGHDGEPLLDQVEIVGCWIG